MFVTTVFVELRRGAERRPGRRCGFLPFFFLVEAMYYCLCSRGAIRDCDSVAACEEVSLCRRGWLVQYLCDGAWVTYLRIRIRIQVEANGADAIDREAGRMWGQANNT